MKASAKDISKTIFDIVKKCNVHPYDINCGDCEMFAQDVTDKHPGVDIFWGDELLELFPPKFDCSCHCFLHYDNLYYDAEEPYGTKHPIFLPCFFRMATKDDLIWVFNNFLTPKRINDTISEQ